MKEGERPNDNENRQKARKVEDAKIEPVVSWKGDTEDILGMTDETPSGGTLIRMKACIYSISDKDIAT